MNEQFSEIATEVIEFERVHAMSDNQLALGSQLSVERIHDIKSQGSDATPEEISILRRYMQSKD